MTIPFSQVKPASLKMKVIAKYPAAYRAGPGISVEQAAGIVTTAVDFANLERDDNTPLDGLYVGAWDSDAGLFKLVLANWLKGEPGPQGTPGPANASDYATLALATAATIAAPIAYLRIAGFYTAGDGGAALYRRVVSLAAGVFGFQSVDGAWWQLAENVVSVLMTGAKGDGGTDDAAAIQIAVTSAYALGRVVLFPEKIAYRITSTINITQAVSLRGGVINASPTLYPDPSVTAIRADMTAPVDLRDFSIIYPTAAAAGTAAIVLTSATLYNGLSRISNIMIGNAFDGIETIAAALWIIEKCYFSNIGRIGILVQNTYQSDAGDSVIEKNTFAGITLASIYYGSSSGLRVINNKINGSVYGLLMEWVGTQAIDGTTNNHGADLWVSNNSIEGITGASISLGRSDASSMFGTVIISDNEMSGPFGVSIAPASNFVINLSVTGNIMLGSTLVPACAVRLRHVQGYLVANNYMQSQFANSVLVDIDATNTEGIVGPNARWPASAFLPSTTTGTASTTISPT